MDTTHGSHRKMNTLDVSLYGKVHRLTSTTAVLLSSLLPLRDVTLPRRELEP